MDKTTATLTTHPIQGLWHPAYLFIGANEALIEHAITILQKQFCSSNSEQINSTHPERVQGCSVCLQCRKVREQQHESILWLCPEKQYALDDLKIIFSTIAFALEENQHFYFVLQHADLLTSACANALLKSLEEPPAGYHFILLAQRTELILPTIKSRCLIEHLAQSDPLPLATLLSFFTTTGFQDPIAFSKELESANPSEWESLTMLDQLIVHWANIYKNSLIKNDTDQSKNRTKQAEKIIHHLKKAMLQPPMPGSSKLFWKNLFLQIKEL